MRQYFTILHRWIGLAISVFLVVAGLSGGVVVFYDEFDQWANSDFYQIDTPNDSSQLLDRFELRENVLRQVPNLAINYLALNPVDETRSAFIFGEPITDDALEYNQFFVDPYTGKLKGGRFYGDISQGKRNLLPFINNLHRRLALDTVGTYLTGIVALLWTVECLAGLYLTFPIRSRHSKTNSKRKWFRRWKYSWLVQWKARAHKFNFDLHRAGGLWVWAMFLVFAWSGVSFNLTDQIYTPVMNSIFNLEAKIDGMVPDLPQPLLTPPIGFRQAVLIAEKLLTEQSLLQGFTTGEADNIFYDAQKGAYIYNFKSNLDIRGIASSELILSATDGHYVGILLPDREAAGWKITDWIQGLHRAQIGGFMMKVFVCLMGAIVAMLSITGILIWWRKRKIRFFKIE